MTTSPTNIAHFPISQETTPPPHNSNFTPPWIPLAEKTNEQRTSIDPESNDSYLIEIAKPPKTAQTTEQAKPHWKEIAAKIVLVVGFIGLFACGIASIVSPVAPLAIALIGVASLFGGYLASAALVSTSTHEPLPDSPKVPHDNGNNPSAHEPAVNVETIRSDQVNTFIEQQQKLTDEIEELKSRTDLTTDEENRLKEDVYHLALHKLLSVQMQFGAEQLLEEIDKLKNGNGIACAGINPHNFFMKCFCNKMPNVRLEYTVRVGTGKLGDERAGARAHLYTPPLLTSELPTLMVTGLNSDFGAAATIAENFLNENIKRKMNGQPLIKKLFMPFVAVEAGAVNHAISAIIELDPAFPNDPKKVRIAIVNPMGGGYEATTTTLAEKLANAFNLDRPIPCVHNQVRQQRDGFYCGLHQVLNIKHWIDQSQKDPNYSVFDEIAQRKLPPRPVHEIQAFGVRLEVNLKRELNR